MRNVIKLFLCETMQANGSKLRQQQWRGENDFPGITARLRLFRSRNEEVAVCFFFASPGLINAFNHDLII